MADTDEQAPTRPYYDGPSTRPRMYAAPFGALPGMTPPTSPPPPGFNVQAASPPSDPMSSLLASFMPSGQDLKQGIAETLGAPVDFLGWAAHRAGLPFPGGEAPPEWTPAPGGRQPWVAGADVPLSSRNIRGMLDNPPPLDAFLQAMRRYGRF